MSGSCLGLFTVGTTPWPHCEDRTTAWLLRAPTGAKLAVDGQFMPLKLTKTACHNHVSSQFRVV